MKNILQGALGVLMTASLLLAACQKQDDNQTPPAPACSANLITPNCTPNNGYYPNGAWPNGAWYWPQGALQPSHGNCGCNSGYVPVQGGSWGFACAPMAYMAQFPVTYFQGGAATNLNWGFWNTPPQNTQWTNIQQSYYSQCQNNTARGCDVRANNCPNGNFCQPVAGGSNIGLCVSGP